MMDMGFWPDVRRIVAALPQARQTLLFSATMPDEVRKQASAIVRGARMIADGVPNGPARTITHAIESMPSAGKAEWLARFLRRETGPVLVFVRTKRGADRLALRLSQSGVRVAALHADRSQSQRSAAVEGLRSGRYTALVATDLAARGLDIDGITHVITTGARDARAYVHRVGRTGRADATGTAVTLVAPDERRRSRRLRDRSASVRLSSDNPRATGATSLILMLLHASWGDPRTAPPGRAGDHDLFTGSVWAIWLVPFVTGIFLG
jgi:ATP-dependent RNA helicase RhlE